MDAIDSFESERRAKSVLAKIHDKLLEAGKSKNPKKAIRRALREGEGSDRQNVSFATIKTLLIDCDVTSPEDVKPFLRKINISSTQPSVAMNDFVDMILEAATPQKQAPKPPEFDIEAVDTAALVSHFCSYYTNLMEYRVEQIEIKLKAQALELEAKLKATIQELETTKTQLDSVKEIAKKRVTALASEVAELTEQLNKEKKLEEEITIERDELKRKLEELRKLPSGPIKLMPGSNDAETTSVPVVTLPRAVSNATLRPQTQQQKRDLSRTKSVMVKHELGELEQLMAELVSPVCPACKQPVIDNPISALGKQWHQEHFKCVKCDSELEPGDRFYETDDHRLLCEDCNAKEKQPFCNQCTRAIAVGEQMFYDSARNAYCASCAAQVSEGMILNCKACNGPIEGDCVNALDAKWHPTCFTCPTCGLDLTQAQFYDVGGFPYCDLHGH